MLDGEVQLPQEIGPNQLVGHTLWNQLLSFLRNQQAPQQSQRRFSHRFWHPYRVWQHEPGKVQMEAGFRIEPGETPIADSIQEFTLPSGTSDVDIYIRYNIGSQSWEAWNDNSDPLAALPAHAPTYIVYHIATIHCVNGRVESQVEAGEKRSSPGIIQHHNDNIFHGITDVCEEIKDFPVFTATHAADQLRLVVIGDDAYPQDFYYKNNECYRITWDKLKDAQISPENKKTFTLTLNSGEKLTISCDKHGHVLGFSKGGSVAYYGYVYYY